MDRITKHLNDLKQHTTVKKIIKRVAKTREYIELHRSEAVLVGAAIATLVILGALFAYGHFSKYVYTPTNACTVFSPDKAIDLIGDKVVNVTTNSKEVAISGDLGTSSCGYTDEKEDMNAMTVAAVKIRSAINDNGAILNKSDFTKARASNEVEIVTGVGDEAFYNTATGLMHVYNNRDWYILNFGLGSDPTSNTVEKTTELARAIGL